MVEGVYLRVFWREGGLRKKVPSLKGVDEAEDALIQFVVGSDTLSSLSSLSFALRWPV